MILKAVVIGKSKRPNEENKYIVRIPIIHGVNGSPQCTPDNLLPSATVCGVPGFTNTVRDGDIVYVSFENDEFDEPVIIGQLISNTNPYDVNTDNITDTRANAVLQTLEFYDGASEKFTSAKLPLNTKIGQVNSQEIQFLLGLRDNVQDQIDSINSNIGDLSDMVDEINGEVV